MMSRILIKLINETDVQGKHLLTEQYVTDNYIYSTTQGKEYIFIPKNMKHYNIDRVNKQLTEVMHNKQRQNYLSQLRSKLTTIDIQESYEENKMTYHVSGKGAAILLEAKVTTIINDMFQETVLYEAQKKNEENFPFKLPLSVNELVETTNINMNIQGQKIETKSNLIDICLIEDQLDRYDHLCNYPIL